MLDAIGTMVHIIKNVTILKTDSEELTIIQ